jgi:hypothetical protein
VTTFIKIMKRRKTIVFAISLFLERQSRTIGETTTQPRDLESLVEFIYKPKSSVGTGARSLVWLPRHYDIPSHILRTEAYTMVVLPTAFIFIFNSQHADNHKLISVIGQFKLAVYNELLYRQALYMRYSVI